MDTNTVQIKIIIISTYYTNLQSRKYESRIRYISPPPSPLPLPFLTSDFSYFFRRKKSCKRI